MGQTNFLEALGWAVINSLWQMALLWIVFQLLISIFKTSSSQKSFLAAIFLVSGFFWFVFTFFSIWNNHESDPSVISSVLNHSEGNEQLNAWLKATLPVASIIYLFLLVLPLARFTRNYRYVQLIRNSGLSKIDVNWKIFVRNIATQMGIKKPVHIWISELVSSPVTIGYLKPIILVPLAAINHLSTQQLEAVLLHELAHIRRHDYIINLIINFIQTLLYFNPFVKSFVRTVEKEREKSCDEMVMQFQYGSYEYASALLTLEKQQQIFRPLIVAAAGKNSDLLQRIEMILGVNKKPLISFNRIAGVFAGLLCIIVLNALLIVSRPSEANRDGSFAQLSSPFYFFTGDIENPKRSTNSTNRTSGELTDKEKPVITGKQEQQPKSENEISPPPSTAFASIFQPIVPELMNYQEEQVKEAVEASRKVIENSQWKAIEKEVADALTLREKEQLRKNVQKELNKYDWKQWEDKLKVAYDKVDWEKINGQLKMAVDQVMIDSLQRVYSITATQLQELQNTLCEHNIAGIPDSDISLKDIEKQKQEVSRKLNRLNSLKNKKIIHL